jgi:hypothetical protein
MNHLYCDMGNCSTKERSVKTRSIRATKHSAPANKRSYHVSWEDDRNGAQSPRNTWIDTVDTIISPRKNKPF